MDHSSVTLNKGKSACYNLESLVKWFQRYPSLKHILSKHHFPIKILPPHTNNAYKINDPVTVSLVSVSDQSKHSNTDIERSLNPRCYKGVK